MKSVIQEASSLMKAIEKGWEKAGSPHEFTVKILEEPQRNFIGLTTKQAKVCILFAHGGNSPRPQHNHAPHQRTQQPRQQQQQTAPQHPQAAQPASELGQEQLKRRPRRRYYHRRGPKNQDNSSNGNTGANTPE